MSVESDAEYAQLDNGDVDVDGSKDGKDEPNALNGSGRHRFLIPPVPNDEPSIPFIEEWSWWRIGGTVLVVVVFISMLAALLSTSSMGPNSPSVPGGGADQVPTLLQLVESTISWSSWEWPRTSLRRCFNFPVLSVHGQGPLWKTFQNVNVLKIFRDYRLFSVISNHLGMAIVPSVNVAAVPDSLNGVPWLSSMPMLENTSRVISLSNSGANNSGTAMFSSLFPFQTSRGLALPVLDENFEVPSKFPEGLQVALLNAKDIVMLLEDICPHLNEQKDGPVCQSCNRSKTLEYALAHNAFDRIRYGGIMVNKHGHDDRVEVEVAPSSVLRLRVFNAASGTNFQVRLGPHSVDENDKHFSAVIVAVDGEWIKPVNVEDMQRRVWLAPGQTLDIMVKLSQQRWQRVPIHATEERKHWANHAGLLLKTHDNPWTPDPGHCNQSDIEGPGLMGIADEVRFEALLPMSEPRRFDREFLLRLRGHTINDHALTFEPTRASSPTHPNRFNIVPFERIRIKFMNEETGDGLAMAIKGHVFQVIRVNGEFIEGARRRVVYVPALTNVTVVFDANNPGQWLIHCVEDMRFAGGMAATLEYSAMPDSI